MAKTTRNAKVAQGIKNFYKVYKLVTVPQLIGPKHVSRVMVLPGLANLIPKELKSSLYYTGQGQLPIIPTMLAICIAEAMNVSVGVLATEVRS
jgi:hypothetical protein